MHDYGRNPLLSSGKGSKFCCHILSRYNRSAGFQQSTGFFYPNCPIVENLIESRNLWSDVRIIRSMHGHVLLSVRLTQSPFGEFPLC